MSYNIRFESIFKGLDNITYTLRISDNQYTGDVINVTPLNSPVIIDYLDSDFDTPIHSSTVTLNLLSEYDRQFIDLFTTDKQRFKVELYKYDVNKVKVWQGYLNSELYSEDLNNSFNYPIQLTGVDGLGLLQYIKYLDVNGNKYRGLDTLFDIFLRIFNKIDINNIFIQKDIITSVEYFTISTNKYPYNIPSNSSIFHVLEVANNNFYDEEGTPLDCLSIIKDIAKTFNLNIWQYGGNIWIGGIYNIDKQFNRYDVKTGNYLDDNSQPSYNLSNINKLDIGNIDIKAGYNYQKLINNGYGSEFMIKEGTINNPENFGTNLTQIETSTLYNMYKVDSHSNYEFINSNAYPIIYEYNFSEDITNEELKKEYYIRYKPVEVDFDIDDKQSYPFDGSGIAFKYKKELNEFVHTDSAKGNLYFDIKALVRTKDFYKDEDVNSNTIYNPILLLRIKFTDKNGNKRWLSNTGVLDIYPQIIQIGYLDKDSTTVADEVQEFTKRLKLDSDNEAFSGEIEIEFLNYMIVKNDSGGSLPFYNSVIDVFVEDIQITYEDLITDSETNTISVYSETVKIEDVETEQYISENYQNKAEEVKVIFKHLDFDNSNYMGCDYSVLLFNSSDYNSLEHRFKVWHIDEYKSLHNRLLDINLTQYSNNRIMFTGLFEGIIEKTNNIIFDTYFPNKKFMIASSSIDISENQTQITAIEII